MNHSNYIDLILNPIKTRKYESLGDLSEIEIKEYTDKYFPLVKQKYSDIYTDLLNKHNASNNIDQNEIESKFYIYLSHLFGKFSKNILENTQLKDGQSVDSIILTYIDNHMNFELIDSSRKLLKK